MSLMDRQRDFDSTYSGLATAIYNVIKTVFTDAILDTDNATVYFDSNKKDGLKLKVYNSTYSYVTITYIIQNKHHGYLYRQAEIKDFSTLYYNISANKDMIAFGLTPGILDFGFGYETKIGYWEFFTGADTGHAFTDSTSSARLFIKDNELYKASNSTSHWLTANTNFNLSLIQLPLFVTSGNFNSLFEVISCNKDYSFNKNTVIFSNNKYYRLLQRYNSTSATGLHTILAMEVADD